MITKLDKKMSSVDSTESFSSDVESSFCESDVELQYFVWLNTIDNLRTCLQSSFGGRESQACEDLLSQMVSDMDKALEMTEKAFEDDNVSTLKERDLNGSQKEGKEKKIDKGGSTIEQIGKARPLVLKLFSAGCVEA